MLSKCVEADGWILFDLKYRHRWDSSPCRFLSFLCSSADLVRRQSLPHPSLHFFSFIWVFSELGSLYAPSLPKNRLMIFLVIRFMSAGFFFLWLLLHCFVLFQRNQWFLRFHIVEYFTSVSSFCASVNLVCQSYRRKDLSEWGLCLYPPYKRRRGTLECGSSTWEHK